jgi:dihydrofolate reductase
MRRLRYQVATSLDGYIAGPNGEFDWICMDPDVDFAATFAQFDTAVMGRKTFLATLQQGGNGAMPGLDVIVFSRTLRPADYPAVSVVNSDPAETVRALKARPARISGCLVAGNCSVRSLKPALSTRLNRPSSRCCSWPAFRCSRRPPHERGCR